VRTVVALALLGSCLAARAEDGVPPEPLRASDLGAAARWARLPSERTWIAGVALDVRGARWSASLCGDVMRMRDPRPGADDAGMLFLAGALGRRIAGGPAVSLHAEAIGALFLLVVGDVGVGAPGVGGGLGAEWRIARALAVTANARLVVPFPIADTNAALRLGAGPLALFLGWRDVRFVPVFGIPGRYSSGPQLAVTATF
jgi:hypothetical protein